MSACVLSICLSIHAIHGEASGHHNSGAPTHSRSHVYSVNRCVCVPRPFLLELIISLFGNNIIYMVAEQVRGSFITFRFSVGPVTLATRVPDIHQYLTLSPPRNNGNGIGGRFDLVN